MKQRTRQMHGSDDVTSFAMGNKKIEDYDDNEIQLYRIKPQDHFIEAQVQENDTLQAIALRFHCSLSELKRINNIHKDNEIYARRVVKVPVTPYSVLTESIPTTCTEDNIASTSNHVPINISQAWIPDLKVNSNEIDFAVDCNEVVMNSTLAPAVQTYSDLDVNELVSEDTQLLTKEKVPVETVVVKNLTSQGADFGIKWYHLMCCLLIIGVVVPLVYVMFCLDKHQQPDLPPLHSSR